MEIGDKVYVTFDYKVPYEIVNTGYAAKAHGGGVIIIAEGDVVEWDN